MMINFKAFIPVIFLCFLAVINSLGTAGEGAEMTDRRVMWEQPLEKMINIKHRIDERKGEKSIKNTKYLTSLRLSVSLFTSITLTSTRQASISLHC